MNEPRSWIKIGPGGTFAASGKLSTARTDIDNMFSAVQQNNPRLLIHMHGGLVPEAQGQAIADAMMHLYGDATRHVSLVWETGIIETFRDNIADISSTRVFKKALAWILSKALRELVCVTGAKGRADGTLDQPAIEALLDTEAGVAALDFTLRAEADGALLESGAKGGMDGEPRTEEEIADELALEIDDLRVIIDNEENGAKPLARAVGEDDGAKGATFTIAKFLAKVILAVVGRYRSGTHHDPLPTAVEELLRAAYLSDVGEFAWSEMKKKAEVMWLDDGLLPGIDGHVGGYLLCKLEALQESNPQLSIDLVGHSAGSIVICAMLAAIKKQGQRIRFRNILFLAPAVRLDTFRDTILPPIPFHRFRMFTMTDEAEKADKLVAQIYPRSLLFLVSGLFEDEAGTPLAGLARYITARTPAAGEDFDELRAWLADEERLVFSPSAETALDGLRTRASHHGDFDNDPITLSSLLYLAKADQ